MPSTSESRDVNAARLYAPDGTLLPLTDASKPAADQDSPVDTLWLRSREYPSRRLTAKKIEEILDEADGGEPERYLQLCEEVEEKEMRIGGAIALRKAAIKSTDYTIMPVDASAEAEACAEFVNENYSETLLRKGMSIILDAIGKPFACAWQRWGVVDGMDLPVDYSAIIRSMRWDWRADRVLLVTQDAPMGVPFDPWTTLRAISQDTFGHPARAGLFRPLVWGYFLINYAMKDWASFVETFGKPFMAVKVPAADFKNSAIVARAMAGMRQLGSSGRAVFDENAEMEFVEPRNLGNVQEVFVNHLERTMVQRILGHDLATLSAPGNGQLGVTAAMLVRADILQGDGEWLSEQFRRDVFMPIIGFNLGWEMVRYTPRLSFLYERPIDKTALANVIKIIGDAFGENFAFSFQAVRDALDLPEPIDETDRLVPAAKASPIGFGGAAGGGDNPMPAPLKVAASAGEKKKIRLRERAARGTGAQAKIDAVARRGETESRRAVARIRESIRRAVKDGAARNASFEEVAKTISEMYPEIEVTDLRRSIEKAMVVAHLYGRSVVGE